MKSKYSFKKYLFTMYQNSLNWFKSEAERTPNPLPGTLKPVIITSFGYIVGDIITYSLTSEDDISLLLNDSLLKRTHELYENLPSDKRNNDVDAVPYITIANANVYTFGNPTPTNMKVINILTDQITGFSFIESN